MSKSFVVLILLIMGMIFFPAFYTFVVAAAHAVLFCYCVFFLINCIKNLIDIVRREANKMKEA